MSLAENKNTRWRISLTDYWFGDSWVYGDELAHPETECFASLVSKSNCVNMGENATSIDSIVYKFLDVKDQIKSIDKVYFCLTDSNRVQIDEKNIIPSKHVDNIHLHSELWYKYFDTDKQQQLNLDRNLFLLHKACPQAKFINIFSLNSSKHIPDSAWLLPSDQCIAEFILPYVHKGMLLTDHPELIVEEWQEQEPYVEKYFYPNHAHPNKLGHKKIAEELCKLI